MSRESEPDGLTPERPKHRSRPAEILSVRGANIIIGVVTAVWATNILAAMASSVFDIGNYQPSESINGIFMTVVGGVLVLRTRSTKDGD